MEITLTPVEVRVLGALIEKAHTTPEYYPLSLNALTNACNQKSNRNPVVDYDEKSVVRALENMRENGLTLMVTGAGSRVAKYKHTFARRLQLKENEVAALCILMLRGPQTVGEIRGRCARLYQFADLQEVEETLNGLKSRGEGAFVKQLPRQPGRKESRFAQLLSGPPEIPEEEDWTSHSEPVKTTATASVKDDCVEKLEAKVDSLQTELAELKQEFAEFKQQFE